MEKESFLVVAEKIDSLNLSPRADAMAHGILLGDKQYFTSYEKQEMRDAGMSHIMAVSGLHIGILFVVLYVALHPLRWFGQLKIHKLAVISLIWFYVFMIGSPVSAIRAALMLSIAVISWIMERVTSSLRILLTSAIIILAFDATQLFEIGFQLSFLATLGILLIGKKTSDRGTIAKMLMVTLSAQIITMPVVAYHFHTITILGWMQGVLVIPLLTVFVHLLLLYLLFPQISILSYPIEWINDWIFSVADTTNYLESHILGGRLALYLEWWEAALLLLSVLACLYYIYVYSTKASQSRSLWSP